MNDIISRIILYMFVFGLFLFTIELLGIGFLFFLYLFSIPSRFRLKKYLEKATKTINSLSKKHQLPKTKFTVIIKFGTDACFDHKRIEIRLNTIALSNFSYERFLNTMLHEYQHYLDYIRNKEEFINAYYTLKKNFTIEEYEKNKFEIRARKFANKMTCKLVNTIIL